MYKSMALRSPDSNALSYYQGPSRNSVPVSKFTKIVRFQVTCTKYNEFKPFMELILRFCDSQYFDCIELHLPGMIHIQLPRMKSILE